MQRSIHVPIVETQMLIVTQYTCFMSISFSIYLPLLGCLKEASGMTPFCHVLSLQSL